MVIALFIDSVKENLPTTCKIQKQIIVCIWTHTDTQMNRHTHTQKILMYYNKMIATVVTKWYDTN